MNLSHLVPVSDEDVVQRHLLVSVVVYMSIAIL